MHEQMDLFPSEPTTPPEPKTEPTEVNYDSWTDTELKVALAKALGLASVGMNYDVLKDGKYVLDRSRIIPLLKDPKAAEAEVDRLRQEVAKEKAESRKRPGFHQD